MRWILLLSLAMAIGCSRKGSDDMKDKDPEPPRPSTSAGLILEDLVGNTDIKAGQRARKTIERVSEQEKRDLDEVLEP